MFNKKAVCKGLLCRKSDRKFKSIISGKYGCSLCMMKTDKGYVTIDEYFNPKHNINWEKMNKEFEEMLRDINEVKLKNAEKEKSKAI